MLPWDGRRSTPRSIVWLLVTTLHLALFEAWRAQWPPPAHIVKSVEQSVELWVISAPRHPRPARLQRSAMAPPPRATPSPRRPQPSLPLLVEQATRLAPLASPSPPPSASSAPPPATLQTAGDVARRALRDTDKLGFRSMARISGTYVGDPAPSPWQRFAMGVAAAAKTDCLAPNAGGSLLSAATLAYAAATDHCK